MSGSLYYDAALNAAENAGVPSDLFLQQINLESGWNPSAVSSTGAIGIAQILPSTAANPGFGLSPVDPTDPVASLNFAAQYDAALYGATGSWAGAIEGYSVGVKNVLSGNTSGVSPGYAALAAQANQEYGGSQNGLDPNDLSSGGNAGLDLMSLFGMTSPGSPAAQGGATPGQQDTSDSVASAITGGIANVEGWLGSKALNVGAVIIGIVFLLIGLFMLAGGKPSDLVAVAAA